jgi:hypothetical protein
MAIDAPFSSVERPDAAVLAQPARQPRQAERHRDAIRGRAA